MTLVEFLAARLDEDQALLQAVADVHCGGEWEAQPLAEEGGRLGIISGNLIVAVMDTKHYGDACAPHIARHDPARVLREVAAKRALLDDLDCGGDEMFHAWSCTLRRLASVYSDHPDYRAEWSPQ